MGRLSQIIQVVPKYNHTSPANTETKRPKEEKSYVTTEAGGGKANEGFLPPERTGPANTLVLIP